MDKQLGGIYEKLMNVCFLYNMQYGAVITQSTFSKILAKDTP